MFRVHSAALCLVWVGACSKQLILSRFVTFGPSGSVPEKMPHSTVRGHAKTHDLEAVHQWRSALSLHTNAKSKKVIFSCGRLHP